MGTFKEELDDILFLAKELASAIDTDWMIIGGIAVASAGEPRNTNDIDFAIGTSVDKARDIDRFLTSKSWVKFEGPGQIKNSGVWLVRYRHSDNSKKLTVDVFFTMSEWQRMALSRRRLVRFMESTYWAATPEDLIIFKLIANRPKDVGDVDGILDTRMSSLDTPYIDSWAKDLDVQGRWLDALTRFQDRRIIR